MNIDRAAFLALATSLAAAACASSGDDGTAGGSSDLSHNSGTSTSGAPATGNNGASSSGSSANSQNNANCWFPATESVGTTGSAGASHDFYLAGIGFDPVANFPAVESFCFKATGLDKFAVEDVGPEFQQTQMVYDKCNSYAKLYVPFTVYETYLKLKDSIGHGGVTPEDAFNAMYELDHKIANDSVVCPTDDAKATCKGLQDTKSCEIIASQMQKPIQANLRQCVDKSGEDFLFSCIESGERLR